MQPQSLQNPIFIDNLKSMEADVFVVVAYRMLPKIVWEIPEKEQFYMRNFTIASWAAPINWAIINGQKKLFDAFLLMKKLILEILFYKKS